MTLQYAPSSVPILPEIDVTDVERLSRTLYVDGGTVVPLPQQSGSIAAPFSTIATALAAATLIAAGLVTIRITAGNYAESIVLPPRDGLALIGDGISETIITGAVGSATLSWAPTAAEGATINTFECRNLSLRAAAGQRAVDFLSSTAAPSTMLGATGVGALFNQVFAASAVGSRFRRIGRMTFSMCAFGGAVILEACSNVAFQDSTVLDNLDVSWDEAFAGGVPGLGREVVSVLSNTFLQGFITAREQSAIDVDETVEVRGVFDGVGLSTSGAIAPRFRLHGLFRDTVTIPFPDLGGGGALCEMTRAIFEFPVEVSVTAGATRIPVNGRMSEYGDTLTAGDLVDFDVRNSQVEAILFAGTGTVNRTNTLIRDADLSGMSNAVPIPDAPFPAGSTAYVAVVELRTAVPLPTLISAKAEATVTVDFTVAEAGRTGDILVVQPD